MRNKNIFKNLQEWEKTTNIEWEDSNLTTGLRHAIIDVGNNIKLSVEVGGNPNNPPLLMVIGLGSQMVFWADAFIKQLIKAGFFIIRFDNRDVGLSSKINPENPPKINHLQMMLKMQLGLDNSEAPVAYNLEDMADDAAALIDCLNLSNINLIGVSMGGIISQIIAAKYPHKISRLILLFSTTNRRMLPIPKPKQLLTLINRPTSHSKDDYVKHNLWFTNTVGTPGHINNKQIRKSAQIRYERCANPRGSAQQLRAMLATGSVSSYSKYISAPTMVIHGSEDGLVPASHGQDIARTIPNAKFELIDGMGHDIPYYFQPRIVHLIASHCLQP